MAAATKSKIASRIVVLLRPSERKRLQKLARVEKVSASEIVRRSLQAYDPNAGSREGEGLMTLFAELNQALDAALETSRANRAEIERNLATIRNRREKVA